MDHGVAQSSSRYLRSTLKQLALPIAPRVREVNARQVIFQLRNLDLLVVPGGAAGPYFKKLGPLGVKLIRRFVANGGSFLGICAGAYFASGIIDFRPARSASIVQIRNLRLFSGSAVGPAFGADQYATLSLDGACTVKVTPADASLGCPSLYLNGGCRFSAGNSSPVAKYQDGGDAIISGNYGKGRWVLSGVHIEVGPDQVPTTDQRLKDIISELHPTEQLRVRLFEQLMEFLLARSAS